METAENTYIAALDAKKRVTIRNAKYKYYLVRVFKNGMIALVPQKMVPAARISKKTLEMMDESMANMKKGKISPALDLKEFSD